MEIWPKKKLEHLFGKKDANKGRKRKLKKRELYRERFPSLKHQNEKAPAVENGKMRSS